MRGSSVSAFIFEDDPRVQPAPRGAAHQVDLFDQPPLQLERRQQHVCNRGSLLWLAR